MFKYIHRGRNSNRAAHAPFLWIDMSNHTYLYTGVSISFSGIRLTSGNANGPTTTHHWIYSGGPIVSSGSFLDLQTYNIGTNELIRISRVSTGSVNVPYALRGRA